MDAGVGQLADGLSGVEPRDALHDVAPIRVEVVDFLLELVDRDLEHVVGERARDPFVPGAHVEQDEVAVRGLPLREFVSRDARQRVDVGSADRDLGAQLLDGRLVAAQRAPRVAPRRQFFEQTAGVDSSSCIGIGLGRFRVPPVKRRTGELADTKATVEAAPRLRAPPRCPIRPRRP